MTEKSDPRRVYIIPIDDKSTESILEDFLRSNGFRFSVPDIPPKTLLDYDKLEEIRWMVQSREGAAELGGDYHI